jgi:hypothetical protein
MVDLLCRHQHQVVARRMLRQSEMDERDLQHSIAGDEG